METSASTTAKVAKLQEATDQAKQNFLQKERALKDSKERLDVAKALLQSLPAEEQQRIAIADTNYPELLHLHQMAQDDYETAQKRYKTNVRYLEQKMSSSK